MPDELYRRCPACQGADPAAPCPTCGGARFVPSGITLRDAERLAGNRDHGRWRVRIGTLMLLVLIAALLSFIAVGWRREAEVRRLAEEHARAERAFRQAQAIAAQANAQVPAPAPSDPTQ